MATVGAATTQVVALQDRPNAIVVEGDPAYAWVRVDGRANGGEHFMRVAWFRDGALQHVQDAPFRPRYLELFISPRQIHLDAPVRVQGRQGQGHRDAWSSRGRHHGHGRRRRLSDGGRRRAHQGRQSSGAKPGFQREQQEQAMRMVGPRAQMLVDVTTNDAELEQVSESRARIEQGIAQKRAKRAAKPGRER